MNSGGESTLIDIWEGEEIDTSMHDTPVDSKYSISGLALLRANYTQVARINEQTYRTYKSLRFRLTRVKNNFYLGCWTRNFWWEIAERLKGVDIDRRREIEKGT